MSRIWAWLAFAVGIVVSLLTTDRAADEGFAGLSRRMVLGADEDRVPAVAATPVRAAGAPIPAPAE